LTDTIVAQPPEWKIAPYFLVDDVVATANYYRDKLGFQYERFWGEPPCFCMIKRSGIIIMLSQLAKTGLMRPNHIAEGGSISPTSEPLSRNPLDERFV